MIKIITDYKSENEIINREITSYAEYEDIVRDILDRVKREGDAALIDYAKRFDGAELTALKVTKAEFDAAEKALTPEYKAMLARAKSNIEEFHKLQLKEGFSLKRPDGAILGQRYTPIEKVGLYIPGGTASLPSTVLMSAVPAKIAGVSRVVMATPVKSNLKVCPEVLYAAKLCGVDEVYKVGGAQAIAALAYGTESVEKVDKIVGPGNIFVALAKKAVFGQVGIDMVAGPSEILIVADESANAEYVAADLLSQAEHDKLATAALITTSAALASAVAAEVEVRLKKLPREDIARASIENNGKIIVVKDIAEAMRLSDLIAPEHLELCVKDPFETLKAVKNAGSVFLGNNTPEPLGDYYAGVNHTLPTSGNAKFSSPLSVDDFVKKTTYLYYTAEALSSAADDVIMFAESEGLTAHANSIRVRK